MDEEPLGLQFSLVQSSSDDKDEKEFLWELEEDE